MDNTRSSVRFILVRALLRWLINLLFRVEVRGLDNIPSGGYILAANHLNWIDGFLFLAFFSANPRIHILGDKQSVRSNWWKRMIVDAVGRLVMIDRTHNYGDRTAMRAAYQTLEEGNILALFPEGRLGHAEGEVGDFQRGIGALCLHSGRPVVPVGLSGVTDLYLGRELVVTIGRSFTPTSDEARASRRIDEMTDQVEQALRRTLPQYIERPVAHKRMRWLTNLL